MVILFDADSLIYASCFDSNKESGEKWLTIDKAYEKFQEGLDKIFKQAGFELREAGCSACLSMNEDKIPSGEYCVSTSNRNFEGRQGPGARTILVSPLMAAAAAIEGKIVDVRKYLN